MGVVRWPLLHSIGTRTDTLRTCELHPWSLCPQVQLVCKRPQTNSRPHSTTWCWRWLLAHLDWRRKTSGVEVLIDEVGSGVRLLARTVFKHAACVFCGIVLLAPALCGEESGWIKAQDNAAGSVFEGSKHLGKQLISNLGCCGKHRSNMERDGLGLAKRLHGRAFVEVSACLSSFVNK